MLANHKHELFAQRYYVYALVDPRDGTLFYIGKGSGTRKSRHARIVRSGRWDCNGAKCERINQIIAAGMTPEERTIQNGLTERAAFELERKLIAETAGLTNIAHGIVTAAESAASKARMIISQMRSYDDWIATAEPKRLDAARTVYGGTAECYATISGYLSEIAKAA